MQAAYILKRLAYLLVTLLLTGSLVFLALRILPGDAETLRAGLDGNPPPRTATPSIGHQYLDWLSRLSRGDLGRSLRDDQSVLNVLGGARWCDPFAGLANCTPQLVPGGSAGDESGAARG